MAVPILQREGKQFGGFDWLPFVLSSFSDKHAVLPSSSPPGRTGFPIGLGFLRVREEHASEGEQPLAFVVFFRVTQEVADCSTHHARPRAPTPPPPIVPVGHLPAVSQGRG